MISPELVPDFVKKLIVIDGANVCWHRHNKTKKPQLSNLILLLTELRELGIPEKEILVFCDSSLKYDIDDRTRYYSMLKKGIVRETPGGMKADEFILGYCLKHKNPMIISNDFYKQYLAQLSDNFWIDKRRVAFMILEDELILVPVLERILEVSL